MLLGLVQSLAAAALLTAFLVPSGFLFGWFSGVFGFKTASGSERLLISVALSLATVPTLAVLLERFLGTRAALLLFVLGAAWSAFLLLQEWRRSDSRPLQLEHSTRIALLMMAIWAALALFSVVDWQIGFRLYPSTIIFDHSVRVPFVGTVIRDGVPPLNPFFNVNGPATLRYYYYWYVVAALPGQLAGIPARACLNGSIVWAGLGLASLLPLFLKHFARQSEVRRKSLVGIGLLLVTGLDLIAFAIFCQRLHLLISDMEWWDPNQVTSWIGSLLWVPHHVGSLLACMTGLLVLFAAEEEASSRSSKLWSVVLAAMAIASGAGLSLYVTFTFAVFWALWMVGLALQKRFSALALWTGASGLSFLLAGPYLRDLLTKTSGAGARFAIFSLRDFPAAIEFLAAHGVSSPAVLDFAKIPIIVLVYTVEFGFFFVVAVLQFRRDALGDKPMQRWQRCAWLLFGCCIFVVTVCKSDITNGNDLGFRGILPAQFILLLWGTLIAADLLQTGSIFRGSTRAILYATLGIGVAGTVCQLALLRGYAWYVDTHQQPRAEAFLQMPDVGSHAYLLQSGFAELDKRVPRRALYQFEVDSNVAWFIHLYADHAFVAGDSGCGSAFGGDSQLCAAAVPDIEAPFQGAMPLAAVDGVCDRHGISVLIATDQDSVWGDRSSWVWQRQALVANEAMRALPCGKAAR